VEISDIQEKLMRVKAELGKVVVGYDDVIELLLVALLSGGHVLLEGPPGIGKTTLARSFAKSIGGSFKRIQMTPDLLPSDVLGVYVYNQQTGTWSLKKGPVFANVLLIDELNRASPKVQSAFLEVMQERQVTLEGEPLPLGEPFMVLATQVPYSGMGTYMLTDVQLDRFGYKLDLSYPDKGAEMKILDSIDYIDEYEVEPVLSPEEVVALGGLVRGVYVHERVKQYIVEFTMWLRNNGNVVMGPSTRASIWLLKGSRALALVRGRDYVVPDDVKSLAYSVLKHRMSLSSTAKADNLTTLSLVQEALATVPVPKEVKPSLGKLSEKNLN